MSYFIESVFGKYIFQVVQNWDRMQEPHILSEKIGQKVLEALKNIILIL